MQHYPKWLYHPTEAPRIVADKDAHDDLIDGDSKWVDTPAKHPKATEAEEESVVEKEALIIQAKALGIDAKGTWGVKKLQDAIAAELDRE